MATMSRTRASGLSEAKGSWNTGWIRRARALRSMSMTRWPSTAMSPALGSSRPRIRRARVDLPQPDSPTTPSTPPAGTAKDTSSTATTWRSAPKSPPLTLKVLRTALTSMAGADALMPGSRQRNS